MRVSLLSSDSPRCLAGVYRINLVFRTAEIRMSAGNNEVYPIETGEGLQQNEGYPEHHSGRRRREMRDSHHKKQNTKVDAKGQAIYVGKIREAAKMFRLLVEKQIGIHSIHLQRGSHQSVCEKAQTSIWSVTRIITAIFIDSLPPQLLLLSDLSGTHFR